MLEWVAISYSRDLPDLGIEPASVVSTALAGRFSITAPPGVQFSSVAESCLTLCNPWTAAGQASLSITNFWSLLKLMSIELVMPPNYLILCHPLLLLPSTLPSIRVFSSESVLCIRWPKYLELQFQHQSFQWVFRIDFLEDWLVLSPWSPRDSQEPSPIPQFKSINSSELNFFTVQLTSIYDYWKNHSLD